MAGLTVGSRKPLLAKSTCSLYGHRLSQLKKARAAQRVAVRAQTGPGGESSGVKEFDADEIIKNLQQKWDAIDNKGTVVVYGIGAVAALWFSSTIVNAINSLPLLPRLLELVGLGYSGWFVYRYLLFKSSREELVKDVDELKRRITGETDA